MKKQKTGFSKWRNLKELDDSKFSAIPEKPGIYKIRWATYNKPKPISRLCGEDEEGILYIGMTKGKLLKERIKNFWKASTEKRKPGHEKVPHSAGNTYHYYEFSKKIKTKELEVSWKILKKQDCDKEETSELRGYISKYLDTPPLNLSAKRW